jgi:hypothetical protein
VALGVLSPPTSRVQLGPAESHEQRQSSRGRTVQRSAIQ